MTNVFAQIEAVCANAVERAFAIAFPSALEPVQVARKLVASFESGTSSRGGRRFIIHLGKADFTRLEGDRAYLEKQWTLMLARLVERAGRPERPPQVVIECDSGVAGGTVGITVDPIPEPARLALRLRKGVPQNATIALDRRVTVGRDAGCDLALVDARVSRRHLEIAVDGGAPQFRDLGTTNGTLLNAKAAATGRLAVGDVLGIGDSELVVEPAM